MDKYTDIQSINYKEIEVSKYKNAGYLPFPKNNEKNQDKIDLDAVISENAMMHWMYHELEGKVQVKPRLAYYQQN